MHTIKRSDIQNRSLRALGAEAFDLLPPGWGRIDLPKRTVVVGSDQASTHLFLPESGLESIAARTDGEAIQVDHIGWGGWYATHRLLTHMRGHIRNLTKLEEIAGGCSPEKEYDGLVGTK